MASLYAMNACKLHNTTRVFSVLALLALASACTIQTSTNDPNKPADPQQQNNNPPDPNKPAEPPVDPNEKVTEVVVVGTNVTNLIYVNGALGLTTVPKDTASNQAVLASGLKVQVTITSPTPMTVEVTSTECTPPDDKAKPTAVGVILDDSGSMSGNDPELRRKTATISFLNTLGAADSVLLTDYGMSADDTLRDLLCVSAGGTDCSPPKAAFSSDKAALIKATEQIDSSGGTPLYESCVQMIPLIDTVKDKRRAMLLLSDGEPNEKTQRDACHNAAKAAQIPVYTVGLGPAAEGDPNASDEAVKVLRELSTDTNGGYASANDPTQLDKLFQNMGTALAQGSCRTTATVKGAASIVPGTKVEGEITIGNKLAKAKFEFVAPKK
jgi:hypothetical protein